MVSTRSSTAVARMPPVAESSEPVKKTRGKGGRGGRGGKKKAKENDDKENGSRQNKENVLVPVAGGNKGKKGSKKENKPKKEKKVKKPRAKRSKKQARGDESESQDSEDFAKQERRMSASIVAQRKAERFRKLSVAHFIGRSAFEVSDEDVMVVDNSVCVKPAFNSGGVAPASQVFSMSIPALSQWSMPADYPFFVVVLFANEGSTISFHNHDFQTFLFKNQLNSQWLPIRHERGEQSPPCIDSVAEWSKAQR